MSHFDPYNNVWYEMLHAPSTKAGVVIFTDSFREFIPTALISLVIALGGLFVSAIIVKIGECCTGTRSNKHWQNPKKSKKAIDWKESTRFHRNAIIRTIMFGLAMLTSIFAFWIAAQAMGVNFWTIVLSYGILGLVATYAFGGPIKDMGAFLLISITNKIEEEWWVEVVGLGVQGQITAIHFLWVELVYEDVETGQMEEAHIPTGYFLSNVIKRKFAYEIKLHNHDFTPSTKELSDEDLKRDMAETAKQQPTILIKQKQKHGLKFKNKRAEYTV